MKKVLLVASLVLPIIALFISCAAVTQPSSVKYEVISSKYNASGATPISTADSIQYITDGSASTTVNSASLPWNATVKIKAGLPYSITVTFTTPAFANTNTMNTKITANVYKDNTLINTTSISNPSAMNPVLTYTGTL